MKCDLIPGNYGKDCPYNGFHDDEKGERIECCCDECDYYLCREEEITCDKCSESGCLKKRIY